MKFMFFKLSVVTGVAVVLASAATSLAADSSWSWSRYGLPPTDNPCAVPTPYPNDSWKWGLYHEWMKGNAAKNKNVIFLGDSITAGWNYHPGYPNGAQVLKEYASKYPGIRPLSLGMSGDEPQNALWLLTGGDLISLFPSPKVIVLMIGINSLNKFGSKNQMEFRPENVAAGIRTIVDFLRKERPDAKILLLGILPCWGPNAPVRQAITRTNELIHALADDKSIFFLDFGDRLLASDGKIQPDLTYDGIHLTPQGYALWADLMFPVLDAFLKADIGPSRQGQGSPVAEAGK